ncbi:MAG TPA: GGDEF domain-containing protein [Nitrospira sp.]|nr:GGDEF domain-containing protein [Nitrospira sp.]
MNHYLPLIRPTRVRLYLLLLHSMFIVLYALHLLAPLSRTHGVLILVLTTLTLLLLTIPRLYIETAWFIGLMTLGNAAVLFLTFGASTDLWLFGAVLLLVTMASYVPTIWEFSALSSLLIGEYGLLLYRATHLEADTVLALPLLLGVTLAFVSKISTAQAEIQRIVKMEEQPQTRNQGDVLTGLPNRAQFLERLTRVVQYVNYNPTFRFAIMFVDLDGFKPINDRLGHKAGDAVLRHVARIFQSCLRQGDLVGRYGGDEFIFLLNQINHPSEATEVAERVLARLEAPIDVVGEPVTVGASIGIAFNTNMNETGEELIRDADQAMYRAKAQGKNRYVTCHPSVDIPTSDLIQRWKRMMQLKWY